LRLFGPSLRRWDRRTSSAVTHFVANSGHIRDQIRACYEREAQVIHPPVRTDFFTPDPSIPREDFWLIAGALEPYKRVDAAIEAAARIGRRLVIVGDGSEAARLRRLAAGYPAISFRGRCSDDELRDLFRKAKVLLFPQVEDFGIVAVEGQACGLPVAARRAGGALDTVTDRTGAFFDDTNADSIARAAAAVPSDCADDCRQNAERFSEANFDRAMLNLIQATLAAKGQREGSARPV